ncbi:hypothetical protein [Dactylosporangium matsuzakiense]|uniref:Tetratricopeptide repeat protein n=1 Tax=Dactylosporangium matsuzakiense TaxID=53360 RepID=A0A9W6NQ38_9ACTN|nr:hypothetical protein [Dactylosporangium matsuzakiense]UWZ44672.1 hypothetical protein Dmats_46340 [Dactylosporangium matsuzakiense]GLL04692.1 hypothetical protein GCM10017581_064390 [Dactylosporangium matsuzakiense]
MTTAARMQHGDGVMFAKLLAEAGAFGPAAAVLAQVLVEVDPATAPPQERLIEAAMLYSGLVDPVLDQHSVPDAVAWAGYAYRASRTRYGRDHAATIAAMEHLATVLDVRGRFGEAGRVRRDLIQTHLDRGDRDAHWAGRMDLADQLQAAGRCDDAIRQAQAAWREWIRWHDPAGPDSLWIVLQYSSILIACHQFEQAAAVRRMARFTPPGYDDQARAGYAAFAGTVPATIVEHRPVCAYQQPPASPAGHGGVQ